jgi:hypothetical protein
MNNIYYGKIAIPSNIALNGGTKKIYIKGIPYNLIIPKGIVTGKILRVRRPDEDWLIKVEVVNNQDYRNRQDNTIYKILAFALLIIFILLVYKNFISNKINKATTSSREVFVCKDYDGKIEKNFILLNNKCYVPNVSNGDDIKTLATDLTAICSDNNSCKIEKLFEYVRDIPYDYSVLVHDHNARSPEETLILHKGDCDDKSNLLVSLFHAVGVKSYLVMLQKQYKHIFVIVEDDNMIDENRFILLGNKKFIICDAASEGSPAGMPIAQALLGKRLFLNDIENIIDPFEKDVIIPDENNIKGI